MRVKEIRHNGNTMWEEGTPIASPFRVVNNVYSGTNTATLTKVGNAPEINLEYSTDNVNWTTWTANANGVRTVSIAKNGNLYLRGDNPDGLLSTANDADYYSFTCSQNYALAGNINSLFSKYETDTVPNYCFNNLFKDSTTLKAASYLKLPATVVGNNAYRQMFMGCTGLTASPHELPAVDAVSTENPNGNYAIRMFSGCTSLPTMPIIRMTRFGNQSCYEMFMGCSTLTNQWTSTESTVSTTGNISFSIAADNGKGQSFQGMFKNCTSLVNASGITATKTTDWHGGVFNSMFYGCTALTHTPSITIGSLASGTTAHCNSMFRGCISLTTVNMQLNATTLYTAAYKVMFYGCTSLVNAPEIKATSISGESGDNGALADMFNGCTKLTYIKVNFTSWNSGNYTKNWTRNCNSIGRFDCPSSLPKTYNASGNTSSPNYIPYGWGVNANPTLPAPTVTKISQRQVGYSRYVTVQFKTAGVSGVTYYYTESSYDTPSNPTTSSSSVSGTGSDSTASEEFGDSTYSAPSFRIKVFGVKSGYNNSSITSATVKYT